VIAGGAGRRRRKTERGVGHGRGLPMRRAEELGTSAPESKAGAGRPLRAPFEEEWRRRFGRFASRHDDDASIAGWTESSLEARLRSFERLWKPGRARDLWLDVGCGAGTYSRLLTRRGMSVVGLDYSWPSIHKAAARVPGVHWIVADATRLPLKRDSFEGALCFGVVQALAGFETLLDELVAAVRPGGEIWIDALNAWCLPHLLGRINDRVRRQTVHVRYESPGRLRRAMRARGLVDVRLYWLPILPRHLRGLQGLFESRIAATVFRALPPLAVLVSHAFVLRARTPA